MNFFERKSYKWLFVILLCEIADVLSDKKAEVYIKSIKLNISTVSPVMINYSFFSRRLFVNFFGN